MHTDSHNPTIAAVRKIHGWLAPRQAAEQGHDFVCQHCRSFQPAAIGLRTQPYCASIGIPTKRGAWCRQCWPTHMP